MRKLKVGDVVDIKDPSWSFGIKNGEYSCGASDGRLDNLTVIGTGLNTMNHANDDRTGQYTAICDILVTDGGNGFWFTQERFCEVVSPEIEVKYFCDGEDVTDSISSQTKRNLAR